MLTEACDHGVEAVTDAPPELVSFIRAMEATPDWVDMKLVEEGARQSREDSANYSPFVIRGAFIATFMNKYSALPMALTGALSSETASRRVKDTASFFITSVLPGALERFGPGFKSAAMVRLMHSMVRFNALKRSDMWDVKTFGIPIPQVDQMPAGLIGTFLLAFKITAQGPLRIHPRRTRACGAGALPLLPARPAGGAAAGDAEGNGRCDDAVRPDAAQRLRRRYLRRTGARDPGGLYAGGRNAGQQALRPHRAKLLEDLLSPELHGRRHEEGARYGREDQPADWAVFGACSLFIGARKGVYALACRTPGLRRATDRMLVRKLDQMLKNYGHAEFTSDAATYRPAKLQQAAE